MFTIERSGGYDVAFLLYASKKKQSGKELKILQTFVTSLAEKLLNLHSYRVGVVGFDNGYKVMNPLTDNLSKIKDGLHKSK